MKNKLITVACLTMLSFHSLSEAALVTKYFESTVTEANGVTLNFLGVGDIFSWNHCCPTVKPTMKVVEKLSSGVYQAV